MGKPENFTAYLDVLQSHQHNFVRFWVADTAWSPATHAAVEPQPYVRTGPGAGADGSRKFDLSQLNQAYFDQLRSHVIEARDRGFYVAVMLFNGWGISEYQDSNTTWNYHPFNAANNINGINGDPNNDGLGLEYHTLEIGAITALQEAYVRKVVDTVNDLDNILYEICNESGNYSTAWQYHLISFIKSYEATKPRQHPVGMTFQYSDRGSGTNDTLFNSPADWISLGARSVSWDPPAADGRKVLIPDTDHFNSESWDATWIWRSFMRGLNPIVMDWWNGSHWDPARRAMGYTRMYAAKVDLSDMIPSSTGYRLSNAAGSKFLVYQPISESTIVLNLVPGDYEFEWFDPATGKIKTTGCFSFKGGDRSFTAPFKGEVVLYVKRNYP